MMLDKIRQKLRFLGHVKRIDKKNSHFHKSTRSNHWFKRVKEMEEMEIMKDNIGE